jgi:hypothetical protein
VATRALPAATAGLAATSLLARASHQGVEPHWQAFIAAAGTDEGSYVLRFSVDGLCFQDCRIPELERLGRTAAPTLSHGR